MPRSPFALIFRTRHRAAAVWLTLGVAAALCGVARVAGAVTLQFDYSLDATGFFGTSAVPTPARTALEFAGRSFSGFTDSLAAIVPTASDQWTAHVRNPSTGATALLQNLSVDSDVILVFAGARNLSGSKLAEAGPGFYTLPPGSSPSSGFIDSIVNRSQGAVAEDFAPWGGFIEFDTTAPGGSSRNWHYDVYQPPLAAGFDFYTVAVHELAHLLGFGTSSAFSANVQSGHFTGDTATMLYGQSVPLHTDNQHWAFTVDSPPELTGPQLVPSLGPSLTPGERKVFTPLDYAAMADIGWVVAPELLRLPGDADGDDDVDGADFLIWQRDLGGFGGSRGDVNGDLTVNDYDGWVIRQNFGAQAVAASALPATPTIPEPQTGLLLVSGVSSILLFRRLRRGCQAAATAS